MTDINKMRKKMVKQLRQERSKLSSELDKVDSMLAVLDGTEWSSGDRRRSPKRRRKMSAAHRKAIADGIRKAKAAKAKKAA